MRLGRDRMYIDELKMDDKVHKILIVDDEKEILEALKMTLERSEEFKSEISLAKNGQSALKQLKKQKFDLILSDFRMPKMDGITFLKEIRRKYPSLVRILITGHSNLFLSMKAINQADVDHYIEKPWHNDELNFIIYTSLKMKLDKENNLRKMIKTEFENIQ